MEKSIVNGRFQTIIKHILLMKYEERRVDEFKVSHSLGIVHNHKYYLQWWEKFISNSSSHELSFIFYELQFGVLFGNAGLNWFQRTVVLLFYCSTRSTRSTRVEGKMWRKEEEVNEVTTNPETSLGEIEILRLFWMEGVSTSYTIPATLLSPVSYCFVLNNE